MIKDRNKHGSLVSYLSSSQGCYLQVAAGPHKDAAHRQFLFSSRILSRLSYYGVHPILLLAVSSDPVLFSVYNNEERRTESHWDKKGHLARTSCETR